MSIPVLPTISKEVFKEALEEALKVAFKEAIKEPFKEAIKEAIKEAFKDRRGPQPPIVQPVVYFSISNSLSLAAASLTDDPASRTREELDM